MESTDSMRDIEWIRSILPHRYPFLFVDRVEELEPGKRIVALKSVTANEEFFLGHFPQQAVMPGVLILEALAQAAGVLLLHDREERESYVLYLTAIEKARFRRPVVPGDQLRLEVEIAQLRPEYSKVKTRAVVDGKVVAQATLSSAIVKR